MAIAEFEDQDSPIPGTVQMPLQPSTLLLLKIIDTMWSSF